MAEKDAQTQDKQNAIVVALVAGLLLGFLVAMLFGAFHIGGKEDEGITNWLQGISGVLSMLVSLYAARLLYKTVQSTQETLNITRSIGDAQTRAWVYESDWTLIHNPSGPKLAIDFQNFGNTPALNILIKGVFRYYSSSPTGDDDSTDDAIGEDSVGFGVWKVLAPGMRNTFTTINIPLDEGSAFFSTVAVIAMLEVTYNTVNSSKREEYAFALQVKDEGEAFYTNE